MLSACNWKSHTCEASYQEAAETARKLKSIIVADISLVAVFFLATQHVATTNQCLKSIVTHYLLPVCFGNTYTFHHTHTHMQTSVLTHKIVEHFSICCTCCLCMPATADCNRLLVKSVCRQLPLCAQT